MAFKVNHAKSTRIETLRSDRQALADAQRSAGHILNEARRLAADGTISSDDLDLLGRLAVLENVIPFLSTEEIANGQRDGSWNKASLDDDEQAEAEHVGRRVVVLAIGDLVKKGLMDAAEGRRTLDEDAGVQAEDESDEDAINNLVALASDAKRHRELSPGLKDSAAEDAAVDKMMRKYRNPRMTARAKPGPPRPTTRTRR